MLIDVATSGGRNVIKIVAEKILKYKDLTTEIQPILECKNTGDNSNNWGYCDHFKII